MTSVANVDIFGEASLTVDDKEHPSAHRESTTGELGEFARRWLWKAKKILVTMWCRATFSAQRDGLRPCCLALVGDDRV